MTREEYQEEAFNEWVDNDYRGIINWGTGVGKTKVAIDACEFFSSHEKYGKYDILWLSPTHPIIENTKGEFRKFKKTGLLKKVTFSTYAALGRGKLNNKKYVLIIFDECHHLATEKRINALKNYQVERDYGFEC